MASRHCCNRCRQRDARDDNGDQMKRWLAGYTLAGAAKQIDQESQTLTGVGGVYNCCAATCLKHSFVFLVLQVSKNRHPGDTVSHGRWNKPPGSRGASFSGAMEQKRWKQSSQAESRTLNLCWDQFLFLEGARTFFRNEQRLLSQPTSGCAAWPERCCRPPIKKQSHPTPWYDSSTFN